MLNLNSKKFYKKLIVGKSKSGGRSNIGCISVRHLGGGHKQSYRLINFKPERECVQGLVLGIFYDPNRNGYIANICYSNKVCSFIVAGEGLLKGDIVTFDNQGLREISSSSKLKEYGKNDILHNIEFRVNSGSKLCRAAGSYSIKLCDYGKKVMLKLPSGELRLFDGDCRGSFGMVSNRLYSRKKLLKAGDRRHAGKRSKVRGVAMNPVDHPHGGNTKGGTPRVTMWGKVAKGKSTRKAVAVEVLKTKGDKINLISKKLRKYL